MNELKNIKGVDSIFINDTEIYVIVKEFYHLDWKAIVKAEDIIGQEIHIRARQSRKPEEIVNDCKRIL